ALQDVTVDLFGSENYGTVAAFGDFNADKQSDIFVIREQSELVIFLADSVKPYFKPKVNITKDILPKGTVITSVVPGDYDGDSQMDVLLTAQSNTKMSIFVFWGHNQTLDLNGWHTLNETFTDQPLVMDFNGDMIPDIFGVIDGSTTRVCYLTDRQKCQNALSSSVRMRIPHSNAFIDLNKDFTAGALAQHQMDILLSRFSSFSFEIKSHVFSRSQNAYFFSNLFLTTEGPKFETWINKHEAVSHCTESHLLASSAFFIDALQRASVTGGIHPLPPAADPPPVKIVGQSSFVDFDGDGAQDHLLPVCEDESCQRSAIYLSKLGSTQVLDVCSLNLVTCTFSFHFSFPCLFSFFLLSFQICLNQLH
ncbi:unnamed protein product, partial [Tetraodon nigroviridis]